MPLIPEAAAIKAALRNADLMAEAVAGELCLLARPTPEEVTPLLCAYIGFKYLLPGAVAPEETLEAVGRRSLEVVKQAGNTVPGMDVLPHCGSASSATHKKILLLLALQRELQITISPKQGADCETVAQLARAVSQRLLAKAAGTDG